MKRSVFVSLAASGAALTAAAPLRVSAEFVSFSGIDAGIRARVAREEFSGVVAVAQGGGILFEHAYGLANRAYGVANRTTTRFNIGSLGKLFTTAVITQLAASGGLRYSDTIGTYLPHYPNADAAAKVTVRQLLDMKSGIGDIFGERFRTTNHGDLGTIESYMKLFADQPLQFEPGTKEQYSNGGFIVLGAIIEAVTKRSFYDVVAQDVFARAGMRTAGYFSLEDIAPDLATGYFKYTDGKWRANTLTLPAKGSPAGGVYAAASDLLAFVKAVRAGTLVLDFVKNPNALTFALGGGAPGINASLLTGVAAAGSRVRWAIRVRELASGQTGVCAARKPRVPHRTRGHRIPATASASTTVPYTRIDRARSSRAAGRRRSGSSDRDRVSRRS